MGIRIIYDDGIMKARDSQRSRRSLPGPCLREGPPPRGRPRGATVASRGTVRRRAVAHAALVTRQLSTLSSFYKWAMKHAIVEVDPIYRADKPKRPLRIPVWLEKEEQQRLEATNSRSTLIF